MSVIADDLARRGIHHNVQDTLPSIQEKWLVDFVNGLSVARDHERVQRARDGKVERFVDSISGKSKRRQDEINASLIDGLEGSLIWLRQLTREASNNGYAIAQVNNRLSELKIDVSAIANMTRVRAAEIEKRIEEILKELSYRKTEIKKLDLRVRARENLDFVVDRWAAGNLLDLSPMARCYLSLEDLRWGAFGNFMQFANAHDQSEWRQNLIDKLSAQLARDVDKSVDERVVFEDYWLIERSGKAADKALKSAVRYLGNWSDPNLSPFAYLASQGPDYMPLGVPRIGAAERVSLGLTNEIFESALDGR